MAHHCAAVPRTHKRPRVQAWFYIPTWQATASAESPSCTGLTATMTYRPSPFLGILPLLGNCKFSTTQCSEWIIETVCSLRLSVLVVVSESMVFKSHFRHGEDLIVTPFAQVGTDYKSINLLKEHQSSLKLFTLLALKQTNPFPKDFFLDVKPESNSLLLSAS